LIEDLTTRVVKLPSTEFQARPLASLSTPELQAQAWEKAGEIAKKGGTGANQNRSGADIARDDICKPQTLKDLDITLDQSSRYKALANAPDDAFESAREHLLSTRVDKPLTTSPHARGSAQCVIPEPVMRTFFTPRARERPGEPYKTLHLGFLHPMRGSASMGARLLSNVMLRPCAREHQNLKKPEIAAATSPPTRAGVPTGPRHSPLRGAVEADWQRGRWQAKQKP